MQPGRELDALIAGKVMKTDWCQLMSEGEATRETGPRKCKCGAIGFPYEHHKPYSTDIQAAWEVVETFERKNQSDIYEDESFSFPPLRINAVIRMHDGKWMARFDGPVNANERPGYYERSCYDGGLFAIGNTAPHAICLAALKAVGVEV